MIEIFANKALDTFSQIVMIWRVNREARRVRREFIANRRQAMKDAL